MVAQFNIRMILVTLALRCVALNAQTFLQQDAARLINAIDHDAQFEEAMEDLMGCRSPFAMKSSTDVAAEKDHLITVERALTPLWNVLPKQANGRAEWKSVRYMVHRYFQQQYGILIRGLETARYTNDTEQSIDVMNSHASSAAANMLQMKNSAAGFTLKDAAYTVAALEKLISNAEVTSLLEAYKDMGMTRKRRISQRSLRRVLKAYLVSLLINDEEFADQALDDEDLLTASLPWWKSIKKFSHGLIESIEYSHAQAPRAGSGAVAMAQRYSFDDAHKAVSDLTKSFSSFYQDQCLEMTNSLRKLDYTGTGRVKLSDFYGANKDGDFRFAESESYLREIGVLDESYGKQVIISNYLQGASNCIITTENYFICCSNPCESIFGDIEAAVGSSLAPPEEILSIIANMTDFDDESPRVSGALKAQLMNIGETHDGQIPLHGRLFAQWLHYVFPYECPFPHKSSKQKVVSSEEFDGSMATESEVDMHAAARGNKTMTEAYEVEHVQMMSQWEDSEELIADYSHLRERGGSTLGCIAKLVAGISLLVASYRASGAASKSSSVMRGDFEFHAKTHLV